MRTRHARSSFGQLTLDVAPVEVPDPGPAARVAPSLSDADHRAIARYVVGLLRGGDPKPGGRVVAPVPDGAMYVRAEQLMGRYQVSMKFIRRHAVELGATRLSDAANSKLRYHLPTADAFIASHRKHPECPPRPDRRRGTGGRSHTTTGAPLVPFT
jgi:hypothetical protein